MTRNCVITQDPSKYNIILALVYKNIEELVNNGQKPFTTKEYVTKIYNLVQQKLIKPESTPEDIAAAKVKAVDHARMTPKHVMTVLVNRPNFLLYFSKNGFDMNELARVSGECQTPEGMDFIQDYIGVTEDTSKILEEIASQTQPEAEVKEIVNTPANIPVDEQTPEYLPEGTQRFTPTPSVILISSDVELNPDGSINQTNAPYYTIVRKLNTLLNNSSTGRGDDINPDGQGAIKLTIRSFSKIPVEQSRPTAENNIIKKYLPKDEVGIPSSTDMVMVLTNNNNQDLYIDKDNKLTTEKEGNKLAYWYLNKIQSSMFKDNGLDLSNQAFESFINRMVNSLVRNSTAEYNKAAALQKITNDFLFMKKLSDYVNKGNEVTAELESIAPGWISGSTTLREPISKLADKDQLTYKTEQRGEAVSGLKAGFTYFTLKSTGSTMIEVERPAIRTIHGLADKLSSLFIDILYIKDAGGTLQELSDRDRLNYIDNYYFIDKSKIQLYTETGTNARILVVKKKDNNELERFNLSDPEDREAGRQRLNDFFTGLNERRLVKKDVVSGTYIPTTYKELSNWQKNHVKTPGQTLENWDILKKEVTAGGITETTYYAVEFPLHNIIDESKRPNFQNIEIITEGDKKILTPILKNGKQESFEEYMGNNFYVHHEIKDGQIKPINPYIIFNIKESELNKIESQPKVKAKVSKSTVKDEGPADGNTNLPDFDKLDQQKINNLPITQSQIDAAKTWYEASPLSKHFPFETLFNVINTRKPNSIASWTLAGITLYKGSDYTDLYHESWHVFTQTFLTAKQREDLYNEVRSMQGSFKDYRGYSQSFKGATDKQLEEWLAEDFREFMVKDHVKKPTPVKMSIFRKILNFLKALFSDVTFSEVVLNERAINTINNLYQNLKVGNFEGYSFNARNSQFDRLDSSMLATDPKNPEQALSYEDSKLIIDSVDSIISTFIDEMNYGTMTHAERDEFRRLRLRKYTHGLSDIDNVKLLALETKNTYKYTSQLLRSKEGLKLCYNNVRETFVNMLNQFNTELEKLNEAPVDNANKILGVTNRIKTLSWVIDNFGDIENLYNNKQGIGVIGYHQLKSQFIDEEEKAAFIDRTLSEEEESFIKNNEDYGVLGNEKSLLQMGSKEVIYLLKSLHQIDKDNTLKFNILGVPQLNDFYKTWNRVAKTLAGTRKEEVMQEKLVKEMEDYPILKQLLLKLGPIVSTQKDQFRLWTAFWQTFNKSLVPLIQANLNIDTKDSGTTYNVRVAKSFTQVDTIKYDWNSMFRIATSTYIKPDSNGENYLDTEALFKTYPNAASVDKDKYGFLVNVGMLLDPTKEIITEINSTLKYFPGHVWEAIKNIHARGIVIRDLNAIIKGYPEVTLPNKTVIKAKERLDSRFNSVLTLQSRYSDNYSSFAVSNAANNTQYEHTLNNTLSIYSNTINEVQSYQELIKLPYMRHLDITRNPFARSSEWLNSIFELRDSAGQLLDQSNPRFGKKRVKDSKPATINLRNLSGIGVVKNDIYTNEGVESASADEFTKLITDIHTVILRGVPELMRHADKQTSFSIFFDNLYTKDPYGYKQGKYYINPLIFLNNQEGDYIYKLIIRYLSAEHERVQTMRSDTITGDYDYNYVNRGKDFQLFDLILTDKTKKTLYKIQGNLEEYLTNDQTLKSEIFKDFANYFEQKYDEVRKKFDKAPFLSQEMITEYRKQTPRINDNETLIKGLLKAFIVNTSIHHIESINLIYGDIAQYALEKEEFHKRNAGAGSTGNIYRTGDIAMNFINNTLGRRYQKSILSDTITHDFDGHRLQTAVFEDVNPPSVYYEIYKKALGEEGAKKYKEIEEEGNAQGYITLDSYRIILSLEGKWTNTQEALYNKIINNEDVESKELAEYFPVQKLQYWGPLDTNYLPINGFHKFSLLPLVPSIIKDTNLELLHTKMMKEGIDYALFKSGSKMGTITKPDGNLDKFYQEGRTLSESPFTKNPIFLEYLKDQLEINSKFKAKVTFSTQLRKLIENGVVENGKFVNDKVKEIVERYEGNIAELTKRKTKELLDEAGWTLDKNGNPVGDLKNLISFIKKELARQEIGDHELAFLDTNPDGSLKNDLSLSLSADKIERMLNSIVVNRLVRQKVLGEGLVLAAGTGFEKPGSNFTNPSSEDLNTYGTNGLPTYHPDKDGKTTAMKVKVALQGKFKLLLQLNHTDESPIATRERLNEMVKSEEWLNKDDNRRMITMVGVRIPVQGHNSMEFMEVYDFLPELAGNIIIPPSEIVAKAGSDYDIDKLSIMMPHITILNKKAKYIKSLKSDESFESLLTKEERLKEKIKSIKNNYKEEFKLIKESAEFNELTSEQRLSLSNLYQDYTKRMDNLYDQLESTEWSDQMVELYDKIQLEELGWTKVRDAYVKVFQSPKVKQFFEPMNKELEAVYEELNDIKYKLMSFSTKAIENEIIWNIRELLELPHNFASLIKPNDTSIVDPVAKELAPYVREQDFRDKDFTKNGKQIKIVSGTRVIEINYNLYKHASNNVGKQSLGMGAVDNTFNALFNRVGAYMNPYYMRAKATVSLEDYLKLKDKISKGIASKYEERVYEENTKNFVKQRLLLPHNTMTVNNNEVISLSHLMDAEGKNSIADVISQLINGWVDVAKDAWVFDVQGNKEITPSLLYMVQAGVPFRTAVLMAAQPLVRAYVNEQRLAKSTFAEPLGKAPSDPNYFRNKAREVIMTDPKYGFNVEVKDGKFLTIKDIYKQVDKYTEGIEKFTADQLLTFIKDEHKARQTGEDYKYSPAEKAALLHFIEIEEMGKAVRDIKMRMNVDTTRSTTLFEAMSKMIAIETLKHDNRFPVELIEKLMGERSIDNSTLIKPTSPISSFYVQPFQVKIWGKLFSIRNNKTVNNFIIQEIRNGSLEKIMENTYPNDEERFISEFRNGLVSYIFQNHFYKIDLENLKSYEGYNLKEEPAGPTVQTLRHLSIGAFIKDDTMYISKRVLKEQWDLLGSAKTQELNRKYKALGLAPVEDNMFTNPSEYYRFVLEREALRSTLSPSVRASSEYISYAAGIKNEFVKLTNESEADFKTRVSEETYEMFLRDKALDNTYNIWKLFRSKQAYARQYSMLLQEFKHLKDDYMFLNMVVTDTTGKGLDGDYSNLKLLDSNLDADKINVMHQNLLDLMNSTINKVADPIDNMRISEFFSRLPIISLLQSGQSTKGVFALTRIVPQEQYLNLMRSYKPEITDEMLISYMNKFDDIHSKFKRASRTRVQPYFRESSGTTDIAIVKENEPSYITIDVSKMKEADIAKMVKEKPYLVFVYNSVLGPDGNATQGDALFHSIWKQTKAENIVGIITKNTFSKTNAAKFDETKLTETQKTAIKNSIDKVSQKLKEEIDRGKRVVFVSTGYGDYMVDFNTPAKTTRWAPNLFLYLSKKLFEATGYINNNYLETTTGKKEVQSIQPLNDDQVREEMRKCLL